MKRTGAMVMLAVIAVAAGLVALFAGTPFEWIAPSFFITILALILGLLPGTKREFGTG